MLVAKEVERLVRFLRRKAAGMRNNAAYNGEHNDGGANNLNIQIDCFVSGFSGTIPMCWEPYLKDYPALDNSRYQEYLKLKAEFEPEAEFEPK